MRFCLPCLSWKGDEAATWALGLGGERLILNQSGFPGLELNGMTSMTAMDTAEVPPPLPLKGGMADYGNLLENQDLISSPTPPHPPPHQRVSQPGSETWVF